MIGATSRGFDFARILALPLYDSSNNDPFRNSHRAASLSLVGNRTTLRQSGGGPKISLSRLAPYPSRHCMEILRNGESTRGFGGSYLPCFALENL